MFERLSRSYQLTRHSWNVLSKDKELMIFPLLSGISSIVTVASFLTPLIVWQVKVHAGDVDVHAHGSARLEAWWYPIMAFFYFCTFFITYYFNVAVMHCAAMRMDGGDPTVSDGFKGANQHVVQIMGWSAISATVSIILRQLEERLGFIGAIVTALIGCAWAVVTYFAVPVLVFERVGVGDAIRRSSELMKKSWGEAMVAQTGISLVFGYLAFLGLAPIVAGIWLASAGGAAVTMGLLIASTSILYWLVLAIASSALTSVFHVALYRYAATGQVGEGFPVDLLAAHFAPRRKRGLFGFGR